MFEVLNHIGRAGVVNMWKILLILVIILILFGAGKLPKVMEDLGKGIRAFKKGMEEDTPRSKKETPKKSKK
jgi:sec-independent protein translocase protein TatA